MNTGNNTFTLCPTPPFRLDYTAWVLRRMAINEMDHWDGCTYSRVLIIDGAPVSVSVVQTAPADSPELLVTTSAPLEPVKNALDKLLGLSVDLTGFYHLAEPDPNLSLLADRFIGFKPPRFPTVFEALINGISCQQISLAVGIRLLNRLSHTYGVPAGEQHAFPNPQDLLEATVDDLRNLGYSTRKAEYILSASSLITDGLLDLERLETLDDDSAATELCNIYGVGRWTAQYTCLRGLGRINVYPADDIASQARIQRWLGLANKPNYDEMHAIIDKWSPYRGLIYFHLLLDNLERQGMLEHNNL